LVGLFSLICLSLWKNNFRFKPFLFTPTFLGTHLGRKTRIWW
jgi:hypothetical protein